MVKQINHEELKQIVKLYYNTKEKPSLFIWGRFGIGKSAVIREISQELSSKKNKTFMEWNKSTPKEKEEVFNNPEKYFVLIDIRLSEYDSSDIKGLPLFKDDKKSIEFKIPYWALLLEKVGSDGILFFDEINLAPPLVISSCYKIIYDKVVNDGKINPNWLVLGAGNTTEDRAYTHEVAPPLLDRGGEVELLGASGDDWITWAIENKIDSRIIGHIAFKNSNLFKVEFEDNQKFTTYRGWERVSNLIKPIKKNYIELELVTSSAIGEGISKEFVAFCKIQEQINLEEVIKNPEKLKEIEEISIKYFLVTAIAERYRENKVKFDKVFKVSKVFDEMNNAEYVALLWRMCLAYNKKFKEDFLKNVDNKFADKYAKYII